MSKDIKENDTLKNEAGEETPKTTPEEEKTPEPIDREKQIKTLQAQKEHYRGKNTGLEEEIQRLKKELEIKSSTLFEKELSQNPDFDLMTDEEKAEYRHTKQMEKDLAILKAKEKMREDYRMLPLNIKEAINTRGGYDNFRDYACLPENIGQRNLLNLAKSFLYEEKEIPEEEPEIPVNPGIEIGTGGEKTEPVIKEGFTVDEIKYIRQNEPDRYIKLAKEGKLKIV